MKTYKCFVFEIDNRWHFICSDGSELEMDEFPVKCNQVGNCCSYEGCNDRYKLDDCENNPVLLNAEWDFINNGKLCPIQTLNGTMLIRNSLS